MADIVIKQIEEGMTGRQVADLLYSNFLALVGAIGSGGGGDIPTADIEKGVTAYGWGDHRQAGYLKGITGGMVTGALGYTPMDEAEWTKANIKATLGIADWALAASKPTYTTKEVTEDGNLYFTDARAVAALAGVTDALAGDIGANATAIGVLQGYFTNGVAKSAAKLQTARKLWGQLFNGTADVTGALTGVTDITASGTLTIGKIKIGDGVIEWDTANGGFKVTGGLWATDYLSSKGVNTGASGGGGGGSSYQRLDTWDGYTSAKDGWVLSAKLGYGLKTTQDDILRQLADISGQGTNVTFTPSLTSGTQIGTLTIDGEPVKMYAPSIPTADINKGVTAYGWGNHASVGYLTSASSLAWGKIAGKPTTIGGYGITDAITTANIGSQSVANANQLKYTSLTSGEDMNAYYGDTYNGKLLYKGSSIDVANFPFSSGGVLLIKTAGGSYTTQLAFSSAGQMAIRRVINTSQTNWRTILHSENYDDYTYSKSTIDTKLSGYLPLSGGTIKSSSGGALAIDRTGGGESYIKLLSGGTYKGAVTVGNATYGAAIYNSTCAKYLGVKDDGTPHYHGNTLIHSGNIGSQSVAGAAKLTTARSIWGQSFDGTGDVNGHLTMLNHYAIRWHDTSGNGHRVIQLTNGNEVSIGYDTAKAGYLTRIGGYEIKLKYGTSYTDGFILNSSGNVGIGTTSPVQKLDVNGNILMPNYYALMSRKNDGTGINLIYCGNDDIIKIGGSLPIKLQGNTTITGTLNMNGAAMGLGGAIDFQFTDEINRYGGNLYLQHRGDGSQSGTGGSATGNVVMCYRGGNVLIGTTTDNGYKLDVNGTFRASGAVSFDSILAVGGATRIDGNVAIGNGSDGNKLYVYGVIRSAAYNAIGNNNAAFIFDKRGSNYTGIGANGVADTIYFGACNTSGAWVTDYYQKWHFNGTIYGKVGIWSDGYVSAKGQNTSSDMRLKRVLEEVTLSVDEIAAAPAVRFAWKGGAGVDVGTSAQYWEKVLPDVVKRDDAGWLTMQYGNAAMVAVIALARRVKELEKQLRIMNYEL